MHQIKLARLARNAIYQLLDSVFFALHVVHLRAVVSLWFSTFNSKDLTAKARLHPSLKLWMVNH